MTPFLLYLHALLSFSAQSMEIIPVDPDVPPPSLSSIFAQTEAPVLEAFRHFGWFRRRILIPELKLPPLPSLREALRQTYLEGNDQKKNQISDEMTMQFLRDILDKETVFFLGLGNALEPLSPVLASEVERYLQLLQQPPMDSVLFLYDADSLVAPLIEQIMAPGRTLGLSSQAQDDKNNTLVLLNPWLRLFISKHTRHQVYTPDSPYLLAAQFEPTRHYPLVLDPVGSMKPGYKRWLREAEEALIVWIHPKPRTWWEWLQGKDPAEDAAISKTRLTHSVFADPTPFKTAEPLIAAMGSWLLKEPLKANPPFSMDYILTDLSEHALFETLYRVGSESPSFGPNGVPVWMTESQFPRLEPTLKELGKRLQEKNLFPLIHMHPTLQKHIRPHKLCPINHQGGFFDEDERFFAMTRDAPYVFVGPPDSGVMRHMAATWLYMGQAENQTRLILFDCEFYQPLLDWIHTTKQPRLLQKRVFCVKDLNHWIVRHL